MSDYIPVTSLKAMTNIYIKVLITGIIQNKRYITSTN